MTKLSFYRLLSISLLLINLGLLAFMFFNRPPARGPGNGRLNHDRLFTELGFGAAEEAAFEQSKDNHQRGMRKLTDQKSELLRSYFERLLPVTIPDSTQQDELLAQIDSLENERIKATYRHFEEVKTLVAPAKEAAYFNFVDNALSKLLLPPKRKDRRRRNSEK